VTSFWEKIRFWLCQKI